MSYNYGHHENSRFIHASTPKNRQVYAGKRPLASPDQLPFWDPNAHHQSQVRSQLTIRHPLGINTTAYGRCGYAPSQHVLGPYLDDLDESNRMPAPTSRDLNGMVNSVCNKISKKLLDGENRHSSTEKLYNASSSSSSTRSGSMPTTSVSIPASTTAASIYQPVPKKSKITSDNSPFKIPAIPTEQQKPSAVNITVTIDKELEKPKIHVSAKDMWEISYKKEVSNSSNPVAKKSVPTETVFGDVINIVPVAEDKTFIYEGVNHFNMEKVEDKISITECKICDQKFSTAVIAKKHYKSLRHQKKLSQFFVNILEPGNGFDLDGTVETPPKNIDFEPVTCTLCSIALDSHNSAKKHFASTNHKQNVKNFLTADDNIIDVPLKDPKTLPVNTPPCLSWDEIGESENSNTVKICRLCGIKMSSLVSSKDHYVGKLHKKRIRMAQTNKLPTVKKFKKTNFVSGGTLSMENDRLLYQQYVKACEEQRQHVITFEHEKSWLTPNYGKFANCTTPSGQFYCTICNLTVPTREKLRVHEFSREHKLAKYRQKSSQ